DGSAQSLYALCFGGDVYRIDLPGGNLTRIVAASGYVFPGENILAGLTIDRQNRLYVVSNHKDTSASIYQNRVTIFRSEPMREGQPITLRPWLKTSYPWG